MEAVAGLLIVVKLDAGFDAAHPADECRGLVGAVGGCEGLKIRPLAQLASQARQRSALQLGMCGSHRYFNPHSPMPARAQ